MSDQTGSQTTSIESGSGRSASLNPGRLERLKRRIPPVGTPVGPLAIGVSLLFLILLTVGLLFGITTQWPVCELPDENRNANVADNRNASPAANANAAVSVTPASTNAAINANNTQTNRNTNTGASNRNTNANASASPAATGAAANATNSPVLDADSLEPSTGPITGKTLVSIKGKNFGSKSEGLVVKFGEREAQVNQVNERLVTVRTPLHSEGLVDVTISRGCVGAGRSLECAETDTLVSAYTYICPPPTGSSLFLMLIMAGALGGSIHALRSLYWYSGQGELRWRWVPMYFSLPFIGAAMAMIFSLLIFAGFVDNNTGRSQALFIIAVAGLVGMFSQQAALKLTDVANAFFTKPGEGRDAEPQESISVGQSGTKSYSLTATGMNPTQGSAAGNYEVKIMGGGFNTSTTVNFGGVEAKVSKFDATSITVIAPPHPVGEVDVELKSGTHTVKVPSKFKFV